ncbi:MAG: glycosyltransferase family 4 protein [Acidobacteriota bacterium]
MHIVFVLQGHPASLRGGAQKQAFLLAGGLVQRGWQVSFISDSIPQSVVPPPGPTVWLPARRSYLGFLNSLPIVRAIRRLNPDIVYHRVSGCYSAAAALGARAAGAGFVWAIAMTHECVGRKFREKPKQPGVRGVLRRLLDTFMDLSIQFAARQSELVVCQTLAQKELLQQHLPQVEAAVVPNCIPDAEPPRCPSDGGNLATVLWVGKPSPYKQPWLFAELAGRFQGCDVEFRMVGIDKPEQIWPDSPENPLAVAANLRLLGRLNSKLLNREYSRASIVVNTSRSEGFPNIFLEAWQMGVPVLSLWRDPGNMLGRDGGGWHFDSLEEGEQLLRRLLNDREELKRAGRSGYELVKRNHTLEGTLDRFESAIAGSLHRRPLSADARVRKSQER